MREIVINSCYGGFSLSDKAIRLYAKLKGFRLYPEESKNLTIYWLIPLKKRTPPINWDTVTQQERIDYNEKASQEFLYDRDIPRDDPTLVEVVKKLGPTREKGASGAHAVLKVIEIPDDVRWEIEEYDGFEEVNEVHRTWR